MKKNKSRIQWSGMIMGIMMVMLFHGQEMLKPWDGSEKDEEKLNL